MPKRYQRINWRDAPSTATPRNARNFNILDKGIDDLDNAIEDVQGQINNLVVEGDSSVEAAQARNTYPTLKARLDTENETVMSQLRQIDDQKAKQVDLETERDRINNIITNGNNIDNAETADIRILTEGAHYNSAGDTVRSFFNKIFKRTNNLFNKEMTTYGYYINRDNGALFVASGNWWASDYIKVEPLTVYGFSTLRSYAFYDVNKIYISGAGSVSTPSYNATITTPTNAAYVRFTIADSLEYIMVSKDGVKEYEPFIHIDDNFASNITSPIMPIVNESQEVIENVFRKSYNLLNTDTVLSGKYINNANGELGIVTASGNWWASDYIKVEPLTVYGFSTLRSYAFYDVNKIYISGAGSVSTPSYNATITTPTNAAYVRFTIADSLEYIMVSKDGVKEYEPSGLAFKETFKVNINYSIFDEFKSKSCNFIGDSITFGYESGTGNRVQKPYPSIVKDLLGFTKVNNYGINGSTIAGDTNQNIGYAPIVERYIQMEDYADYIIVAAGTNDFGSSKRVPLGTINDSNNTTFYGAMNNLCIGLVGKYINSQIMFVTPLKRGGMTNEEGLKLEQFVSAIKEVCSKYSIPVLDMYNVSNFHIENQAWCDIYAPDKLHGTQSWYNIHGKKVAKFIQSL